MSRAAAAAASLACAIALCLAGRAGAAAPDGLAVASDHLDCDGTTDESGTLRDLLGESRESRVAGLWIDAPCLERGGIAVRAGVLSLSSGMRIACASAETPAARLTGASSASSLVAAEDGATDVAIEGCRLDLGGSSSVAAIDFRGTRRARVRDVVIDGAAAGIRIGAEGEITGSTVHARMVGIEASGEGSRVRRTRVEVGGDAVDGAVGIALAGIESEASANRVRVVGANARGIRLAASRQVATKNEVEVSGTDTVAIAVEGSASRLVSNTWSLAGGERLVGVDIGATSASADLASNSGHVRDSVPRSWHVRFAGRQLTVTGGSFSGGAYCIAPDFTTQAGLDALNVSVANVRCIGQHSVGLGVPTGGLFDNNYVAWIGAYCDPVTSKSSGFAECTTDLDCGGDDCSDDLAACTMCRSGHGYAVGFDAQHHDFESGAAPTHASIRGGLIHSGQRIGRYGFQGVRFGDTRKTEDSVGIPATGVTISGVSFYGAPMMAAIDLRELGANSGAGTKTNPVQVEGNLFDFGDESSESFAIWGPDDPVARARVQGWTVLSNTLGGAPARAGWTRNFDWRNGTFDGNQPAIGLEQPSVVWNRKVGPIAPGGPAFLANDDGETAIIAVAPEGVEGIWLGVALSGGPTAGDPPVLPVAVAGEARCLVADVEPVSVGTPLAPAELPLVGFRPASDDDVRLAISLEPAEPGSRARCLVLGPGAR